MTAKAFSLAVILPDRSCLNLMLFQLQDIN